MNIVIDKSFLRAATAQSICEIAERHTLVISDALVYECTKESSENRAKLFMKFPSTTNPYVYAPITGELMRYEIINHTYCGIPSNRAKERDYSIHTKLIDEKYELTPELKKMLDKKRDEINQEIKCFGQIVQIMFEGDINRITDDKKTSLENRIANDADYVNDRILHISKTAGSSIPKIPKNMKFDERWVTYRWFQVCALFAMDLRYRYENFETITNTPKALEKLRHDILDAKYLILATLEGGFATKEKKLVRWWRLLQPKGCLYE